MVRAKEKPPSESARPALAIALEEIAHIFGVRFGTITLHINDGRLVQTEAKHTFKETDLSEESMARLASMKTAS